MSTAITEEAINLSLFSGSLSKGAHDTGKNCWSIPENNSFRVRSKRFLVDKSKVSSINLIPFHYQTCMLSHVPSCAQLLWGSSQGGIGCLMSVGI
jgi:hypothetical protein